MSERQDFEMLLLPLLDAAFGLALHMTRNRADAEDLVQDAVVKALRAYDSFQQGTNFKAWFFRILTNRFHDQYRRRRARWGDCSLDDTPELHILRQSKRMRTDPALADPGLAILRRMDADQVAAALQELPEDFRLTATLYFIQDFSYQDMADMMGIPIGTVRSRLHRARRMLQKRLWQLAEDSGLATNPVTAISGSAT